MNKLLITLFICILFANLTYSLDKSKDCKCKIQTNKRIIGGRIAHHTAYPWMTSISMTEQISKPFRKTMPDFLKIKSHGCGGVIINEFWILTAAHCLMDHFASYSIGFGGDNDLVKIYDNGRIPIKRGIIHPNYGNSESFNFADDIALLELDSPIDFEKDSTIGPGCIDPNSAKFYESNVMITGFGLTSKVIINLKTGDVQRGEPSRFLKELEYKDISNVTSRCKDFKGVLCVDSESGIEESGCFGDSGGPMHYTQNGKTTIIGVTSGSDYIIEKDFTLTHCNGKAFYTRVGYYLDWIKQYVGDNHC